MTRDPINIVGQIVAEKYRIEKLVGEGGFAVVYRAMHTIWNKPVAIKFFNGLSNAPIDQRDQFKDAFIQEGALLTELSSQTASIVQARDVGTYTSPDGFWMPYMVLEWLEGFALDELLERDRTPWGLRETLALLGQAAAALDVAHTRGIAHRDIKPANLFVLGDNPRSGRATIKVLDFGVAKMMSDNTQLKAALAKTGMSVTSFTPAYGAPEQFSRSHGATGPWTDVFALALVAVEMLTGRPALDGDDIVQLAYSAGDSKQRPTPRTLGASIPDSVEEVFGKALAVRPADRYARAGEFWAALEAANSGGLAQTAPQPFALSSTVLASDAQPQPLPSTLAQTAPKYSTGGASSMTAAASPEPKRKSGMIVGGAVAVAAISAAAFFALGRKTPDSAPSTATPAAMTQASVVPPPAPVAKAPCPADMVQIPAGQFFMGSDKKDAMPNEGPTHNVKLDSFCMDLHEVTAKQYKECSNNGKCRRAGTEVDWPGITPQDRKIYSTLCTADDPNKQDHPINCVSWDMASTYCKAQDRRLPTEAEWEYATRGPDGRVYPWGDEDPTPQHLNACGSECVAWGKANGTELQSLYSGDDGYPTTAPVGKFPAGKSRFGPFDVVGNVWEWAADWSGPYKGLDSTNPTGPEKGDKRVIRGGAWNGSFASWLRPSFRYAQAPKALSHGIGFRCARPVGD
jgi:formylglycine-generating enzyme required for sulfatase activity/serine/threonine protein kinase